MRVQVNFVGRVQGVGFRATARSIASRFPITGWVRNEPDRSVLLEAQGKPDAVDGFLAELARVMERKIERVRRTEVALIEHESGFTIQR